MANGSFVQKNGTGGKDGSEAELVSYARMKISYDSYLDKVLGGWIGKSIGGTLGCDHEGFMIWMDLKWEELIPKKVPPNDDLDLQVLWLKVLEEKGLGLTADDLAKAWLEGCWYPFNEYGNFRRNWRNGLKPPFTGRHDNALFDTGMGCPIRSEIWGYVFPGRPERAAAFARLDGQLDHGEDSICAEELFAAMAADAFFISDVRALFERHRHYLKPGLTVTRLVDVAVQAFDTGVEVKTAWDRVLLKGGVPEPCDARPNVPFTIMALLYGRNDLRETVHLAHRMGYDTDCTMATAGAFIGQIYGASGLPPELLKIVGDELVMGIEYRRPEMTLSALARDTAAVGVRFTNALGSAITIESAPALPSLTPIEINGAPRLTIAHPGALCAAPGEHITVSLTAGNIPADVTGATLVIDPPAGWSVSSPRIPLQPSAVGGSMQTVTVNLGSNSREPRWAQGHLGKARVMDDRQRVLVEESFGVPGVMLWRLLAVCYQGMAGEGAKGEVTHAQLMRGRGNGFTMNRHYVTDMSKDYIGEALVAREVAAADKLFASMSATLGEPAVLACPDFFVPVDRLIRLDGEWIAYLDATFHSPVAFNGRIRTGSNSAFHLWLNGESVVRSEIRRRWTPYQHHSNVSVIAGANRLLLKLGKHDDLLRFSLGFRTLNPSPEFPGRDDWATNLSWANPFADRI
jgi:ADP-ribosylglycohydrolase